MERGTQEEEAAIRNGWSIDGQQSSSEKWKDRMPDDVIELSVDETNDLRAKLGLKPLRIDEKDVTETTHTPNARAREGEEEVLEMSVEDTNALRAQLGLAPLRVGRSESDSASGNNSKVIHKPAENLREVQEAEERVERAKLQRDVNRGISKVFGSSTLAEGDDGSKDYDERGVLSWASKMRTSSNQDKPQKAGSKKKKKTKKASQKSLKRNPISDNDNQEEYDEKDLEGINVAHDISDLQAGSTTILTLADDTLLETKDSTSKRTIGLKDGDETLENVNLSEQQIQQDGLAKKRQYELGAGRAGGYAGYDDDEFAELGGTRVASRLQRGASHIKNDTNENEKGFRIGQMREGSAPMSDLEAIERGRAISLVPTKADVAASDFMTLEEEEEEKVKRKKDKDGKFKKKKKKDKIRDKKKKRRRRSEASDDEDEDNKMDLEAAAPSSTSLLDDLEQTAVRAQPSGLRKRRREDDAEDDQAIGVKKADSAADEIKSNQEHDNKRARYNEIMAKGNERTKLAFMDNPKSAKIKEELVDDEPDDSFLNAALAKARRMNRLKELSQQKQNSSSMRGADAVAKAVMSIKMENEAKNASKAETSSSSGTMSFATDDTREFTRAIRARARQTTREQQQKIRASQQRATETEESKPISEGTTEPVKVENVQEEEVQDMDIEELAKEIKPDEGIADAGLDGTTVSAVGVGRGMSAFVTMLRHTGEISSKQKAGVEELRGRAKDERNYDHYKPVDLKEVVKIGDNATDKDKELASREIKLEYRDKHGRLLTSKEAFRDLCYQFHGYGKGKRNEEKQLQQIAREQAEARLASRQVNAARDGTTAGTLGALRATQKATGKAFVVHKT